MKIMIDQSMNTCRLTSYYYKCYAGKKTSIIGSDFIGKEPNFSVASSSVLCKDTLNFYDSTDIIIIHPC